MAVWFNIWRWCVFSPHFNTLAVFLVTLSLFWSHLSFIMLLTRSFYCQQHSRNDRHLNYLFNADTGEQSVSMRFISDSDNKPWQNSSLCVWISVYFHSQVQWDISVMHPLITPPPPAEMKIVTVCSTLATLFWPESQLSVKGEWVYVM